MGRVFALLVGINDYPEGTSRLQGCLNDVEIARQYLTENFADPAIEVLTNGEATYANIIAAIKTHLGQAGQENKDDVAMLHYSGHGDWSQAAPEFHQFDRDKRDQGLVCVDSPTGGNYDLADKELAVLIADLAKNAPHITLVFDCCYSGTGTRDLQGSKTAGVRGIGERNSPRRIETYIDGRYAQMLEAGAIQIPQHRHILMAACDRDETAKENSESHQGFFTTALYEILRQAGGDISYAELYVRTRARVHQYIRNMNSTPQRPQFETIAGFDGWSGFLGRAKRAGGKTYVAANSRLNLKPIMVARNGDKWVADAGAIAGIPLSPTSPVTLSLAPEAKPDSLAGLARLVRVGGSSSDIEPDFAADPALRYVATVTSMPADPLRIDFAGDAAGRSQLARLFEADPAMRAVLAQEGEPDDGFLLTFEAGKIELSRRDDGTPLAAFEWNDSGDGGEKLLAAIGHVARWRQLLELNNPFSQLKPAEVDFAFACRLPDGSETLFAGPTFTLDVERRSNGKWHGRTGQFRIRNRTGTRLNFALLHFGSDYSVKVLATDVVAHSDDYMTIAIDKGDGTADLNVTLWLDQDREAVEQYKLVLGTEPVDAFLLEMEALTRDRAFGLWAELAAASKTIDDDWFALDMRVRIAPRLAVVGSAPASLASGQIVVEAHGSVSANLALVTQLGPSRGVGTDDSFAEMLAGAGITPAGLAGARGDEVTALDITGISDPATLASNPLMLRLDLPLKEGEVLLPMVRDGAHLLPAGDFWRSDDGSTQLAVNSLPAPLVDHRNLGGSLRIWFFKTAAGIEQGNRLRHVTFDAQGKVHYIDDGAARKTGTSVLLVIHGLIGDTRGMLEGLHQAGLDSQFDCVLAYDYQNLSTPIDQTARQLASELATIGLTAEDAKTLTIVAHSTGGLVSRWFVEKGGGAEVVDHLVMCGTPNMGSPFGEVGNARKVFQALFAIAANFALPVCASAATVLSASAKITPTLEQMAPGSELIDAINTAAVPTTRYTILAGDIARYEAPDQAYFEALLAKIGRSAPLDMVFGGSENDIAVTLSSILLDDMPVPRNAARITVGCHHLNYFSSPAGQAALQAVVWN